MAYTNIASKAKENDIVYSERKEFKKKGGGKEEEKKKKKSQNFHPVSFFL